MSGIQFSALVTDQTITFTGIDGKNYVVGIGHPNGEMIRETLKSYQKLNKEPPYDLARVAWRKMTELADIKQALIRTSSDRIQVRDGVVYYDNEIVQHPVTSRIVWSIREGYDPLPYMIFLENLMENPSKASVDQLYSFMEHNNMGITEDGCLIVYKAVREDYTDQWTGTIDNTVGQLIKMRRNLVQDDPSVACAPGLHVCEMKYLRWYGSGRSYHIMICKVNPRDVVSVPTDHRNGKIRCCEYEVIGEYTGEDKDFLLKGDPLSEKPIFSNADFDYEPESFYIQARDEIGETRFLVGEPGNIGLRTYIYGAEEYTKSEAAEICDELSGDPEFVDWTFALVPVEDSPVIIETDDDDVETWDDEASYIDPEEMEPHADSIQITSAIYTPVAGYAVDYVIVYHLPESTDERFIQEFVEPDLFRSVADIGLAKRLSFSAAVQWQQKLEKLLPMLVCETREVPRETNEEG